MAETRELTLSVPDISCEHCVRTIDNTLGGLAGVERVSTDLDSKSVRLRFDPAQVTLEQIEARLDEEGYPVVARA